MTIVFIFHVFVKSCSTCFAFSVFFFYLLKSSASFFVQWRRHWRARAPLLLQVESRAPETTPVFVMPAAKHIKVEGLLAAATYAAFPINFTNRYWHFKKVDFRTNKSPPSFG